MQAGKTVMIVLMEPEAEWDDEFNRWYNELHIPERIALDGYVSARRFKLSEGEFPKYLCIWELEDPSALQSPAYLEQRANTADWVKELQNHVKSMGRGVFTQIFPAEGAFEDRSGPKVPD